MMNKVVPILRCCHPKIQFHNMCGNTCQFLHELGNISTMQSQAIILTHGRCVAFQLETTRNYCTVSSVCERWRQKFHHSEVPEPKESAELIVAHAMGKKMIHEVPRQEPVPKKKIQQIDEMCRQRLKRRPVQYLLGEWDFYGMTLTMREPVLIPRPETEVLVDCMLEDMKNTKNPVTSPLILDVGCGTGAIGLFLLNALPEARCVAVDKSPAACELTRENSRQHYLQNRITVLEADFRERKTIETLTKFGQYDIIVSNPPYIPSAQMHLVDYQVINFEDHDALDGGHDGLDIVRVLLETASELLKDNGCLWLEVDLDQPRKIREIVKENQGLGLIFVDANTELTHLSRICKLQKKPARRKE